MVDSQSRFDSLYAHMLGVGNDEEEEAGALKLVSIC